jgi:hypothetical protein
MEWILEKTARDMAENESRVIEFGGYSSNSPYAAFDAVLWPEGSVEAGYRTGETPATFLLSGLEIKTKDPMTAYKGRVGSGQLWIATPAKNGLVRVPSNEMELEVAGVPLGVPVVETFNSMFDKVLTPTKTGPILNLTQHVPTKEQVEAGVVDLDDRGELVDLLTFVEMPTKKKVRERAEQIAKLAGKACYFRDIESAMIGGAPFLMAPLEQELLKEGVTPVYAFSVRESVEKETPEGVVKTAVFRHKGFV